ncbi:MAG: hypothetical protein IJR43_03825 [Synergistaceae bacterium]|nr:hypothetical protein [Synergistaceae bacterium]
MFYPVKPVNPAVIERNKRLKRIDDLKIKIMILKNESAVCYAKGQNDLYELKKAELDNLNAELNLLEFIHNHDSFQNVNPEPEEKPGIIFWIVYIIICLWLFGRHL